MRRVDPDGNIALGLALTTILALLLALALSCGGPKRPAEESICWDLCPGAAAVDHERPATVGPDGWVEWCECHCAGDYYKGAEFALIVRVGAENVELLSDISATRAYFVQQCK